MTIQNILDWLQEAEDNNIWEVSTQSVKRHLEEAQKKQLNLHDVVGRSEQLKPLPPRECSQCGVLIDNRLNECGDCRL